MTTPYPTLTDYRVTLSDGSSYITSMAHDVTLAQARAYFVGRSIEQPDEKTSLVAVNVEAA